MKLQNFGFVLALVALLPCLIEGRPKQNYLNGILFEAPADVPKSDSVRKFSFEEFHNELVPIFEILSAHLPLSKLKDRNEFKKFLETEVLYDLPEHIQKKRSMVSTLLDMADDGISMIPMGELLMAGVDFYGGKEKIINLIGAKEAEKAERELHRTQFIEAGALILKTMNEVLEEAFNEAVEEMTVNEVNKAVKNVEKLWRPRVRMLRKKLGLPTKDDRGPKHKAINTKNNQNSQ